tara:strand:+ start:3676 stop:3852 length:177 start_codon:yes stop_codon:yes gene_type:complete
MKITNMEKNLVFVSDTRYIDEVLASTKKLRERSVYKNDVDIVISKLKNIKLLCQQKTK